MNWSEAMKPELFSTILEMAVVGLCIVVLLRSAGVAF
jgi:hypothetical protein